MTLVGNLFIATYLKDARTSVKVHKMDGAFVRDVDFSTIATAYGFEGSRTDSETFYLMMSFILPPTIYRYDLVTGESAVFRRPEVTFRPDDFAVKQVFYRSKDGTRIPMFLSHKKGIALDGGNPTLLYGYGGFDISLTPRFLTSRVWWLEQGGVLAVANLRGGGEYGEAWHKGRHENEQAKRLRRLHRSGRMADRQQIHSQGETGDPGSQQRRPSCWRCFDAAAGSVCRCTPGRRSDGHAPLSQVHGGPLLDRRLRFI